MEIFKSILPVLFFITINSAISLILKKGFGKCLPLTLIASTFIVFLSQIIFKTFIIGLYLLLALFVLSIFVIYKNKQNKQYIFTNGFYVFICICLIFLFIDFGRHFFWDDEVGFWGKMVKEMFRLDRFYYLDESTLRGHNDYPPFMPLFEFIWCKLSLGYSECNCTYALHIFEFSLLVPTIFDSYFENKKILEKIIIDLLLTLGFVGIVVYLDASDVFNTIYIDTPIAMQFAYCIYLIYSKQIENTFGTICFVLSMAMMIMTKQVALAFCLLAIFYYIICNYKDIKNKNVLIGLVLGIALPICAYFGWNLLIKPYDIVKQFDFSKISAAGLLQALNANNYQTETIKLYVNALFKNSIYSIPLPITFISSLLVEILLLEIIKRKTNKENISQFEITCVLGTIGYALLMFILYVFCYPEREALSLICYDRYMSSYIAAIVLSIVIIAINILSEKINSFDIKKSFIICLIVLAIFDANKLLNFVPQVVLGNRFAKFEQLAINIDNKVEKGSKIFVVYNHDDVDDYPAFMSYYSDNYYTKRNMDLCGEDYSDTSKYNQTISNLSEYDYIYVANTTESFENYFAFMFDNNIRVGLYKANNKGNAIYLDFIYG